MSAHDIANPLTRELAALGASQPRLRLDELVELNNPSIPVLFAPLVVLIEEPGKWLR